MGHGFGVAIGAIIATLLGYIYITTHASPLKKIIKSFIKSNPDLPQKTDSTEEIIELIQKGESEKIEFKETLRVNIHTNDIDKRIEYATLKAIVAMLNTQGGTLLVGVNDKGEITGIEKDRFENPDKFSLHLTNIIRERIGKKYLQFINLETTLVEGKYIMKVNCIKTNKPVFLKESDGTEEFYIRVGPSSSKLIGSELVEYIERKFKKENEFLLVTFIKDFYF